MVAMPVGQRPEAQLRAWMQPKANIKGRAMLTQSAPSAQCFTISKALIIFPEAAILILDRRPAPRSVLSTKTRASVKGLPRWSLNSVGAAPVPPSAPSTDIKSSRGSPSVILLTMAINSQGWPIQSLIPTGLPPLITRSSAAKRSSACGVLNSA